jgi:transcriptional regulator with XRE-family HTH domain
MTGLCDSFGLAMRQLRQERSWSQEMLAEKADLNRSYIGELERGQAIPSLITLDKLADAFGVSAVQLLTHCERIHYAQTMSRLKLTSIAC